MLKHFSNILRPNEKGQSHYRKKVNSSRLKEDCFDFLSLIKNWQDIVGEKLAKTTSPLKINNQSLIIIVQHSAYAQQVDYLAEMIKKKIYTELPLLKKSFKYIRFQVNPGFFSRREERDNCLSEEVLLNRKLNKNNFSPEYLHYKKRALEDFEDMFEQIQDEELKELFLSLQIQKLYANDH